MMALSDEALARAFWNSELAANAWTHTTHLRMAWLALEDRSLDEAHLLVRVGIIKLNAFQGLVETKDRGYHETLTRVWLVLVGAAKNVNRGADSLDFLDQHPHLASREAPLRHYSKARLFSLPARAHFVDPDLEPLPHA